MLMLNGDDDGIYGKSDTWSTLALLFVGCFAERDRKILSRITAFLLCLHYFLIPCNPINRKEKCYYIPFDLEGSISYSAMAKKTCTFLRFK